MLLFCGAFAAATEFSEAIASTQFAAVMPSFPTAREAYVVHDMRAGAAPASKKGPLCLVRRLLRRPTPECFEYSVGQYDERRMDVYATDLFANESYGIDGYDGLRNIHMGVDLGAKAGTPVHAPYDGIVHSFGYNEAKGDYGHVIITQHQFQNVTAWFLYGHLSAASVAFKRQGARVKKGEQIAFVGAPHENGDWPPHLHFQVGLVEPKTHDMPGVVSDAQHAQAKIDYPDPRLVVGPLY